MVKLHFQPRDYYSLNSQLEFELPPEYPSFLFIPVTIRIFEFIFEMIKLAKQQQKIAAITAMLSWKLLDSSKDFI